MIKKKILITGANGFIGSNLFHGIKHLSPITTSRNTKTLKNKSYALDLSQNEATVQLIQKLKPELVFHFAALTSPKVNEENPLMAINSNSKATKNLVSAIDKNKTHLIFLSTDKVFDGTQDFPNEISKTNPKSLYGKLKLQSEITIKENIKKHHILRLPIVHSFGDPVSSSFVDKALINLQKKESVEALSNVYRCFIDIKDLVNLLIFFISDDHYGTYHLGNTFDNYYNYIKNLSIKLGISYKNLLTPSEGNVIPLKQNLDTQKINLLRNTRSNHTTYASRN